MGPHFVVWLFMISNVYRLKFSTDRLLRHGPFGDSCGILRTRGGGFFW